MTKRQLNLRVSDITRRQLDQLIIRLGTSITETITIAIDRLYQQETQTMTRPTYDETLKMATAVYHAAYPNGLDGRPGEPNPDKLAEIEEWLSGPGGWADYAEPDSLAAEWLQLEGEVEAGMDR